MSSTTGFEHSSTFVVDSNRTSERTLGHLAIYSNTVRQGSITLLKKMHLFELRSPLETAFHPFRMRNPNKAICQV